MVLAAGCGSQQKIMGDAKGVDSGELTGIQKAFMDYVRSDAGLKIVEDMGFIPVK